MAATPPRGGLFSSLRNLVGSGVALLHTRLELLSVELKEERSRLFWLLVYGASAAVLFGFGLFFLAAFFTVLLWDSYRLLALGVSAAIFLFGGVTAYLAARSIVQSPSRLFAASLEELARDRASLRAEGSPQ